MYELSAFVEKLYIQNCTNSTGNSVYYMYELSGFAEKLNIQNSVIQRVIVYIICLDLQKKNEHLEQDKFYGKLCTLYVRNVWICRKIEYPE